jgi:hypothetical protein
MSYLPQQQDQYDDLQLASKNYWAGRTGREDPPAPTYRMVNGRMLLGRYMDPFGCAANMRAVQGHWRNFYLSFFFSAVGVLLGIEIDWAFFVIILPLGLAIYFIRKGLLRAKYERYEAIAAKIAETGEPQWVPYPRKRLKTMDISPPAVAP